MDKNSLSLLKRPASLNLFEYEMNLESAPCVLQSGLFQMFHLQYWKRVWIHQQIVLARNPIFLCGSHALSDIASFQSLENWSSRLHTLSLNLKPHFITDGFWYWLTSSFLPLRLNSILAARKAHRDVVLIAKDTGPQVTL